MSQSEEKFSSRENKKAIDGSTPLFTFLAFCSRLIFRTIETAGEQMNYWWPQVYMIWLLTLGQLILFLQSVTMLKKR